MTIEHLLADVICRTFLTTVGNWQSKYPEPKALVVSFSTTIDHEKEDGYRKVDLALYASHSYVSVYVRERWTVIPLEDLEYNEETDTESIKPGKAYTKGESPWKLLVCHDSCWRSDGVQDFIRTWQGKLQTFDMLGEEFYKVVSPKELGLPK